MSNVPMSYHSPQLIRRILASGAVGNVLETYDLILVSLMAITLSDVFFPPLSSPYAHVIDILYIFLIGLLVRPIGNVVMGSFADQMGRKKLMIISLIFTGLGTTFIGLLPSYKSIGIWSTALFVSLRIFQNFFAGIEYINSASYLIENSKKNTRGFYGSWTAIGISGGYLLASFVALMMSHFINKHFIPEWGWRLIFLCSSIGIAFGLWIRYSILESLTFMINNSSTQPAKKWNILKNSFYFIKEHPSQCLSISALTMMGSFLSYIYYIYIPINLMTTRDFSQNEVLSLNVFSLLLVVMLIPIFGRLSDSYGRIKLLKITCFLVFILAMPFFWVSSYGTYLQILFFSLLISAPSACFFALYPVIITENFPPRIRCTTASLIYQIVVSLQMGIMPLVVVYLIKKTNILYSPGYLLIASTLIGFLGLIFLKETNIEKNENKEKMLQGGFSKY